MTATAVQIRSMTLADIADARELADTLRIAQSWDARAYEVAVLRAVAKNGIALIAAAPGFRLAGFLITAGIPPELELELIAVAPAMQRQGVARRLMELALDQARHGGCRQMLLEVRNSNLAARRLYESLGFCESGRRKLYYHGPDEDAVLMQLDF